MSDPDEQPWPRIIAVPMDVSREDIDSLQAEGVIAVRTKAPESVRVIGGQPGDVDANTLLMSALEALAGDSSTAERTVFVRELLLRLKEKEATP